MLFPIFQKSFPEGNLKKGRWKFHRAVFVVWCLPVLEPARRSSRPSPRKPWRNSRRKQRKQRRRQRSRPSWWVCARRRKPCPLCCPRPTTAVWRGFHCFAIPVITNHACAWTKCHLYINILNRQNEHCAYFVCLMSYFIRSEWNLGCEVCSILYWLFNYIYIFK